MDKDVLIAILNSARWIIAATIPSIVGIWSTKQLVKSKLWRRKLNIAYKDLLYMNELENQYLKIIFELSNKKPKAQAHQLTKEKIKHYKSKYAANSVIANWLLDHSDEELPSNKRYSKKVKRRFIELFGKINLFAKKKRVDKIDIS